MDRSDTTIAMKVIKCLLLLPLAIVLVGCASEPSIHLEGFRNSLRKLDESYAEQNQPGRSLSLLNSQSVQGMEDAGSQDLDSWRYLAFQSEMYRGMSKGDKPSWYRKAAKEEVGQMTHAPEDLKKFVLDRTEQATSQRQKLN